MHKKDVLLKTEWTDPVSGARGYLVIDGLVNDLCGGGIRMRPGLEIAEIEGLARVMTAKFMAMGIPCGGAKGGISYDPGKDDSSAVLKRYLLAHRPLLKENWGSGEDLGTREEEILSILAELDLNTSVHAVLNKAEPEEITAILGNLITGLNMEHEGMVFTDVATGYGVAVAAREALKRTGLDPAGASASIQGFGTVGGSAALYLWKQGIKMTAVSDAEGTIYDHDGLNIPELLQRRNAKGIINRTGLPGHYHLADGDRWLSMDVDLLIPAAISDAITGNNAGRVQAALIVEGANMPVSDDAEQILLSRNIKIVPDYIANSGGVGLFGGLLFHRLPADPETIMGYIERSISGSVNRIFDLSIEHGLTLRRAAAKLVQERKASL